MIRNQWAWLGAVVAMIAAVEIAEARPFGHVGPGGSANLPYTFTDGNGGIWRIYAGGWMQQQGQMPIYSQGCLVNINGNAANQQNNSARVDDKTGELVIENMPFGPVTLTRRIFFDKDDSTMRYIEIVHNTQNQDQSITLALTSNFNFGINDSRMVPDTKRKDQNIAWAAQTGGGNSVVEMYAGKNSKNIPVLSYQQGNNMMSATYTLNVPAGRDVAVIHIHKPVATQDAGAQFVNSLKEAALLKSLPAAIRRAVVNFPNSAGYIGEVELLRGDQLDVVELRTGDQYRGSLQEASYTIQTFYGSVQLDVNKVVGIVNLGAFRPRQLVVTSDGQIFGGRLSKETVDIKLSSGQIAQIPLNQINRVGYRRRAGEPDEWLFERPLVYLRSGERCVIQAPAADIEIATRYGKVAAPSSAVSSVSLQNEENAAHVFTLTDGSKFTGLMTGDEYSFKLESGQATSAPLSAIARLQLAPKAPEVDDLQPTLHLSNEDVLVGTLQGVLHVETNFDTITINASEVRLMTRVKDSVQDVTVSLWDGTTISGQLKELILPCQLKCGVALKIPLALLEDFNQPQPQPSPSMLEKLKELITQLNADDWKERDRAKAALVGLGPVAITPLKELRTKQPAQVQKDLDIVLQKLDEARKKEKPLHSAVTPSADVPQAVQLDR